MMVHCRSCEIQWEIPLKFPVLLRDAAQIIEAWGTCPHCGAGAYVGPLDDKIPSVRQAAERVVAAARYQDEVPDVILELELALERSP
jgi:hypothetical protein